MAINRYDTPAESNYFNTFVPLPLDQITALGMKRQEDLERRQDTASKYIDQASLVDYIANSKDEQWVKNEYMPTLQKYAEEAMSMDLTNPVEWAKYSTKLRGIGTSETIRRIEESKARWNQAQEMKQKLMAAGKYNQLLDEDPASGWDSSTAVYNYMPEAYTDKAELFEQYYKHMKPRSKGVVTIDGVRVLREGIDSRDIKDISARAAQELAASPLGQQQIKLFNKMYPDIAKNMSDTDILRTQMEDYGQQFISSNDQVLPESLQGNGTTPSGENTFKAVGDIIPGEGWDFDPAGISIDMKTSYDSIESPKGSYAGPGGAKMFSPTDKISQQRLKDLEVLNNKTRQDAVSKIVSYNPDMQYGINEKGEIDKSKKLTNSEIFNNYQKARDDWKKAQTLRYKTDNAQVQKLMGESVGNYLDKKRVFIQALGETVPADKFFSELGYKPGEAADEISNPNKSGAKVTGVSLNSDKPFGYSLSINKVYNKNNKYAKAIKEGDIIISGEDDIINAFTPIYTLKESIKQNRKDPVALFYDQSGSYIEAIPDYTYNYVNGKPKLDVKINTIVHNADGSVEDGGETTFNELYQLSLGTVYNPNTGRNPNNDTKGLYFIND